MSDTRRPRPGRTEERTPPPAAVPVPTARAPHTGRERHHHRAARTVR
ncbi:hypothetical protein [Streptomyces sp. NPDC001985]